MSCVWRGEERRAINSFNMIIAKSLSYTFTYHTHTHTSISSLCIRTRRDTFTLFPVLVLRMVSPRLTAPWYTRTYVNWPNRPAWKKMHQKNT